MSVLFKTVFIHSIIIQGILKYKDFYIYPASWLEKKRDANKNNVSF